MKTRPTFSLTTSLRTCLCCTCRKTTGCAVPKRFHTHAQFRCLPLSVHHSWNGMGVCELVFHFLNLERFTWCKNHSCSCFGKNSVVFNWILVARQRHSCAWKNSAPPTQHMIFDTFAILQLVHMNVVVNFLASQPQLRLDFMNDLRLDEVHTTFS